MAKVKSEKSKGVIQDPYKIVATTAPSTIPKAKGITFRDADERTTRTPTSVSSLSIKDKGKVKMDKLEVPLKKKDQIALDEEMARNLEAQLQAELIEEEMLARKKEKEANKALIESWNNTQAMMEAYFKLAQRPQAEEQGEITIKERSRLFVELMNKRKKHFAMLKAEEKRRKLPTKSQKRNLMSTYLKKIGGYKYNQFQSKSYDEIQKLFDNEMKRINTFIPIDSEVVKSKEGTEESSKRIEDELESDKLKKEESSKQKAKGSRKKSLDEHEEAEEDDEDKMKIHIEVVQDDEEIATNAYNTKNKSIHWDQHSDCDLSLCDDISPINVYVENTMTFSNPLFDSNDDFTSSDDESLSDEDVLKENVKIYSNPLFEFDDEYISSDVNPLFDEVLEDIESKDSYVSNLDESALLVTPLSDFNEDECFDQGFTDEPPLEENDDLFDLESKENKWKKILYDAPIDDLMTEDKVFAPGILEKKFSPTYVSLPFEDRHYLSLLYVIRIFLPYLTFSKDSSLLLSSGSEDTIFDPGISVFSCYSLEPVVSHRSGAFMCFNVYLNILNESPMEIFSSTCFVPNITMIWGESS
ncbi:hypothetical protein Tco_1446704 [Tanacetum coccineum]